jgi:ferredoxin
LKAFEYTSYLDEADIIINFSKLKTHGMMGLSAAVKNMFGAVPGTKKTEYHYRFPETSDFANMLIDLNEYFTPQLSIVDAVVGMEGNGPTAGKPRKIGALLASQSPYKLDLACAHIIGLSIENVPTLAAAYSRGLIPADIHDLDISCNLDAFHVRDFEKLPVHKDVSFYYNPKNPISKIMRPVMKKVFSPRPVLGTIKCAACGKCVEVCPAKAIVIKNKKAAIDRNRCIRCFCCQEFCPVGAMVSTATPVARLLGGRRSKRK